MDKILINRNRGLFHDHRKSCRLLAQQLNKCIDYINWLEDQHGAKIKKIRSLEERVENLEALMDDNSDLRGGK